MQDPAPEPPRRAVLLFVSDSVQGNAAKSKRSTTDGKASTAAYRKVIAEVCDRLPREMPVIVHFEGKRNAIFEWLVPLLPLAAGWEPQTAGDFGARLRCAFAWSFATGWNEVAAITNIYAPITNAIFAEAFTTLATSDLVVGPTPEGAPYLLAIRAPQLDLLERIRWEAGYQPSALFDGDKKLRIHSLPVLEAPPATGRWN